MTSVGYTTLVANLQSTRVSSRSNPCVWWITTIIQALAIGLGVLSSPAIVVAKDVLNNLERSDVSLKGELTIGEARYSLRYEAMFLDGKCQKVTLIMVGHGIDIETIFSRGAFDEAATVTYGQKSYSIDNSKLDEWSEFLLFTPAKIRRRFRSVSTRRRDRDWILEPNERYFLRPGLPAKLYFVFDESETGELRDDILFKEVVAWSPLDWSNSFNENVSLHLSVQRGQD